MVARADEKLKAKCARIRESILRDGAPAAMVGLLNDAAVNILANTPRDTNRLYNGLAQAFNDTGLGPFPILPLVPSRNFESNRKRLEEQLGKWQWLKLKYEHEGRTGQKYFRKIEKSLLRAQEELAKYATGMEVFVENRDARRIKLTVRPKVYGGRGRKYRLGGRKGGLIYEFRVMEPHAIIRERRDYFVATELRRLNQVGVRRVKRAILDELRKSVGGDTVTRGG